MSPGTRRLASVVRLDFNHNMRRPLFLVLILIVVLTAWGLSSGELQVSSGDSSVGGKRAWLTSEYANAQIFGLLTLLYYSFFVVVAAGMSIPHDEDLKVGPILHTTGLRASEYVWGKFGAVFLSFLSVLALQIAAMAFVNHVLPNPDADKIRGPFALVNYVRPALVFAVPTMLFLAGVAFALGEATRRPIVVFSLPVATLMVCLVFFWQWTPAWLDPRIDRVLMLLDPSGFRWLNQTWLKVDRGVDYYNKMPIAFDAPFLASRALFALAGILAVVWSQGHFRRTLRGAEAKGAPSATHVPFTPPEPASLEPAPLATLGMRQVAAGLLRQALEVARFEFRGLAHSPGLYLFVPLILLQTIPQVYFLAGPYGTWVLATPGGVAVRTMNTLTLCVCLLLLFYTAESLHREQTTGLAPIFHSTPVRTGAVLLGKALANSFVGVAIMGAVWLAAWIIMRVEGKLAMDLRPFLLVWGLLLVPTFLVWSAFVMAVLALTKDRYTTYALALGALILTGYMQLRGKMTWVWNWDLWSTVRWSDLGLLEPNAWPLLLNRVTYLGLTVFFIALTVRTHARREFDATRIVHSLSPGPLLRACVRLLPYAVVPMAGAIVLWVEVSNGFQGEAARKREKDYWKQNLATWKDAPLPAVTAVDLDLSVDPARHHFRASGSYDLVNLEATPIRQVALTLGRHIREAAWTMEGKDYKPEDRSGLYVFTPPSRLGQGEKVRIGFRYEADFPGGITRNGGGMMEFVEPSGFVLGTFRPVFAPSVGWDERIGVKEDENKYEPKAYAEDYYRGIVQPLFGSGTPMTTRIRIDAPKEYTLNSVGTLLEERVEGDRRRVLWVSDHPFADFNVVAGRWAVRRGEGTAIYYHPGHAYNVEEMIGALDASRKYFSLWFHPYPWKELKLSEFADLATYAQGYASNITFSEGVGFLTRSSARGKAAFTIVAHEAAHQWWGNLLVPGKGPGGNILSEGMAHFSTLLLHEQVNGLQGRIEFAKRIEETYGEDRRADAERPLVKIDGDKQGDETVTYDKGGWVFFMLHRLMGREANLAGLRAFVQSHLDNPDHPLLEDFVEEMRPFAPDPQAFDAFTRQWFFEVVVPEYKLSDVKRVQEGNRWIVTGALRNVGTGDMPVAVATTRGDRFEEQTEEQARRSPAPVSKEYEEARAPLRLAAGQSATFRLECRFRPETVIVDPDALVLQLRRKDAVFRF